MCFNFQEFDVRGYYDVNANTSIRLPDDLIVCNIKSVKIKDVIKALCLSVSVSLSLSLSLSLSV